MDESWSADIIAGEMLIANTKLSSLADKLIEPIKLQADYFSCSFIFPFYLYFEFPPALIVLCVSFSLRRGVALRESKKYAKMILSNIRV